MVKYFIKQICGVFIKNVILKIFFSKVGKRNSHKS